MNSKIQTYARLDQEAVNGLRACRLSIGLATRTSITILVATLTLGEITNAINSMFLCQTELEKRISKNGKPYFVCFSCGNQLWIRGKAGIERLEELFRTLDKHKSLFRQRARSFLEVQAIFHSISAIEEDIKQIEGQIGLIFQDEDKIRICKALKTKRENLLLHLEKICEEKDDSPEN